MATQKEYWRLPGWGTRRRGLFSAGRCRIWLGSDHILCTDYAWYAEDYKRFYFRDIQAFIIRKTPTATTINVILGAMAIPPLAAAIVISDSSRIVWIIIAAVFAAFLGINLLYGPTCVTQLQTAVQIEELPSLGRLRRARKVLARLRPHIAAAQGELPPEEIPARMAGLAPSSVATAPPVMSQPPVADAPPIQSPPP